MGPEWKHINASGCTYGSSPAVNRMFSVKVFRSPVWWVFAYGDVFIFCLNHSLPCASSKQRGLRQTLTLLTSHLWSQQLNCIKQMAPRRQEGQSRPVSFTGRHILSVRWTQGSLEPKNQTQCSSCGWCQMILSHCRATAKIPTWKTCPVVGHR